MTRVFALILLVALLLTLKFGKAICFFHGEFNTRLELRMWREIPVFVFCTCRSTFTVLLCCSGIVFVKHDF